MRISFYFIFKTSILLLFLHSMNFWLTWSVPTAYIGFFVTLVMISYSVIAKVKYEFTLSKIIGAAFLLSAFYIGYTLDSFGAIMGPVFILFPCMLLLFMKSSKIPIDVLDFIANFFAVILPISLFVFLLTFINLPSLGKITPQTDFYGNFDNYIFALRSEFYGIRFSSVFIEPGHLGMISAYLLYALKFNLKDIRVLIILFSSLFTLSLAAYLLILIGYVFNLFASKRLKVRSVIGVIILMGVLYIIAINYNDGNNLLNDWFFARLTPSEDKIIAGNNRTFGMVDDFYEIFTKHQNLLLWGLGVDNYNFIVETVHFGGAGIKIYILRQGLVSVFFVFLGYLFIGFSISKNWRYTLCFILLFAISFWQRAYPFWASWLIPFIAGVQQLKVIKYSKKDYDKNSNLHSECWEL